LSLVSFDALRDTADMPPDRSALFLLTGSFNVVTIATVAYCGFPCPLTPLIRQRGTKLYEWGSYPYDTKNSLLDIAVN
jgi:hypothetical protein